MPTKDTIIAFNKPEEITKAITDTITELAREGARQILARAIEDEVSQFLELHRSELSENGSQRFVRNGNLPERTVQTGIGDIPIQQPRVRDRKDDKSDGLHFSPSIFPPYIRRTKSLDALLPVLYLRGISTGDFKPALAPILGDDAKNVSPGVISRLKAAWEEEYQSWNKRDISRERYVYWWADGIYLQARMEDGKDCVLVVIAVTDRGEKRLLAIEDGFRESKDSWQTLIRSLKQRGLKEGPKVAVGDGALGFWAAITEEFPQTSQQRCWVHKTCNVLDKLPKSLHGQAKDDLHEIWMSATKEAAEKAFDAFIIKYSAKYPKATECLMKDRAELLAFYNFPAEHWKSLRTTNPIESTFSTVRHRTRRSRGCFSRKTILTMVFKICQSSQERWNRLHGFNLLAEVIRGVKFVNGLRETLPQVIDQTVAA